MSKRGFVIRIGDMTTGGGTVVGGAGPNAPTDLGITIATRKDGAICCGGFQPFVEWCLNTESNPGENWIISVCRLACGHYPVGSDQAFPIDDEIGSGPAVSEVDAPAAVPLPAADESAEEEHWLDLRLTNNGELLPGQRYVVTDAAGQVLEGALDDNAYARVSPLSTGTCRVDFPDLGYSTTAEVT